jgi:hypothetical protein
LWLAVATVAALIPALAFGASPRDANDVPSAVRPVLIVSPSSLASGQTIHVSVTGAPLSSPPPIVYCLGVYGPGQNAFTNQSPAFRVQIGTIGVGADGSGQADVAMPSSLVPGVYQVVVGGCAPHAGLAPLAWFASASVAVGGGASPPPTPRVPTGLPRTGDFPEKGRVVIFVLGGALLIVGARARGARRGEREN